MNSSQLVEAAVDTFYRATNDADQTSVLCALEQLGASPKEAWHLFQFIPMAFAHTAFEPLGVRFQDRYIRLLPSDARETRRLADEPYYRSALAEAYKRRASASNPLEALMPVYLWSAEFAAIQELVHKPEGLRNVCLTEPILLEYEPS
ncbi:MAG: hypothetical protein HOW73_42505 [Polyangiaceae bacterium]|nr:hypothetical protein [Polyangiaceae bacterium]